MCGAHVAAPFVALLRVTTTTRRRTDVRLTQRKAPVGTSAKLYTVALGNQGGST
jgi:hypothetical protein